MSDLEIEDGPSLLASDGFWLCLIVSACLWHLILVGVSRVMR